MPAFASLASRLKLPTVLIARLAHKWIHSRLCPSPFVVAVNLDMISPLITASYGILTRGGHLINSSRLEIEPRVATDWLWWSRTLPRVEIDPCSCQTRETSIGEPDQFADCIRRTTWFKLVEVQWRVVYSVTR